VHYGFQNRFKGASTLLQGIISTITTWRPQRWH